MYVLVILTVTLSCFGLLQNSHAADPTYVLATKRLNEYRKAAGLNELQYDLELEKMAQAHADFYKSNCLNGHEVGNHYEDPNLPGYTKQGDEAARTSGLHFGNSDALQALEYLIGLPFHRLQFIKHDIARVGVGRAQDESGKCAIVLFVTRPEASAPKSDQKTLIFPPDQSVGILTSFARETPDPRPVPYSSPTGYPITVHFVPRVAKLVSKASATMESEAGEKVDFWISDPSNPAIPENKIPWQLYGNKQEPHIAEAYQRNFYSIFLLPKKPLKRGLKYKVEIRFLLDSQEQILKTEFKTAEPRVWDVKPVSKNIEEDFLYALEHAENDDRIVFDDGAYSISNDKPIFIRSKLSLQAKHPLKAKLVNSASGSGSFIVMGDGSLAIKKLAIEAESVFIKAQGSSQVSLSEIEYTGSATATLVQAFHSSKLLIKDSKIKLTAEKSPVFLLQNESRAHVISTTFLDSKARIANLFGTSTLHLEKCDLRSVGGTFFFYLATNENTLSADSNTLLPSNKSLETLTYRAKK